MTADERDDVTSELQQLRDDLQRARHAPVVEGAEHRRDEKVAVMEHGIDRLQLLLDSDPVCERCEGLGFDGGGEPCGVCA